MEEDLKAIAEKEKEMKKKKNLQIVELKKEINQI